MERMASREIIMIRTLTISHIFVATSVADFKLSPTTGTAWTTEPRTSSAAMA
jgi:hypothetical protein